MDEEMGVALMPEEIRNNRDNLEIEYSRQASEARERFDRQYQRLVDRWEDKEKAKKLFESFSFSGAVKLSTSEYESLTECPLKRFIDTGSDNYDGGQKYSLQYGGEIYLRAEAYYQFYDRKQTPSERCGLSIDSFTSLVEPLAKIQEYVLTKETLSIVELKIYLSYLDHLKAELLRLFHAQVNLKVKNGNNSEESHSNIERALREVSDLYYRVLEGQEVTEINLDVGGIDKELDEIRTNIEERASSGESLDGIMRGLPESDHPLHNKIYAIGVADRLEKMNPRNVILGAMHFGGVELPWVISQELSSRQLPAPEILTVHYSRYTNRNDSPSDFWKIVDHQANTSKKLLLLDDGVYSGESLKIVQELAIDAGFDSVDVSVQKLANSRQMGRMMTTGGVNPNFVDQQLVDSIGVSPFFKTETEEDYLALKKKGHFNIVAERVRRMLVTNYADKQVIGKDLFINLK